MPTAQVIRRFRDLGTPVREVGEVLATTDPEARSALTTEHLERLENQLEMDQGGGGLAAPTAPARRRADPG